MQQPYMFMGCLRRRNKVPVPRYSWVFNTWFVGRQKPFQKVGGPTFWNVFGGSRGRPYPNKSAFFGRPQNHVLKTQVYTRAMYYNPRY